MQRDENGNANNVVFYAILANLPICYFCSKVKTQKSKTHNSKYLIQNIMTHIGFRKKEMLILKEEFCHWKFYLNHFLTHFRFFYFCHLRG